MYFLSSETLVVVYMLIHAQKWSSVCLWGKQDWVPIAKNMVTEELDSHKNTALFQYTCVLREVVERDCSKRRTRFLRKVVVI